MQTAFSFFTVAWVLLLQKNFEIFFKGITVFCAAIPFAISQLSISLHADCQSAAPRHFSGCYHFHFHAALPTYFPFHYIASPSYRPAHIKRTFDFSRILLPGPREHSFPLTLLHWPSSRWSFLRLAIRVISLVWPTYRKNP